MLLSLQYLTTWQIAELSCVSKVIKRVLTGTQKDPDSKWTLKQVPYPVITTRPAVEDTHSCTINQIRMAHRGFHFFVWQLPHFSLIEETHKSLSELTEHKKSHKL